MHKVRLIKGVGNKRDEYKELCPNPECNEGTVWVYPENIQFPACSYCKAKLEGKWLMKLESDRRNYHLGA